MIIFSSRTDRSAPKFLALAAALCALAACDKSEPTGPASSTKMLTLTSPATGSKVKVGDSLSVKWTTKEDPTGAGRTVSAVDVMLSPNGGTDWGTLTRSGSIRPENTKQWGNYKWLVTDSIYIQDLNQKLPLKDMTHCRVKIQDYSLKTDPDLADESGDFTVTP